MCLAVPAEIISVDVPFAAVKIKELKKKVNVQLIEDPQVGDYVLIHAGFAIQKISEDYFSFLNEFLLEELNGTDEVRE